MSFCIDFSLSWKVIDFSMETPLLMKDGRVFFLFLTFGSIGELLRLLFSVIEPKDDDNEVSFFLWPLRIGRIGSCLNNDGAEKI